MSTIGNKAAESYVTVQKQTIAGNGGTSYTLNQAVSNAADIEVFVNNTRQEPIVAYNASSTTLTMTGAVNSSDSFYVIFQGKGITSVNHPPQSPITATNLTVTETATVTGNITTSGTVNTSSINGGQIGGRRNLIINGNFQCWQRNTNVTGLGTASGYFTADRWRINLGGASAGRFTMSRTAGDPDGFNYGLVINCTTADTSIAADEQLRLNYRIEGQDLQQLEKGTSTAKAVTISFYAKVDGSATNFVVELQDSNNTRTISKMFTFTNTWTRYYWTVPGDTTGALNQDTSMSMTLNFWLHAGSTHTSGTLNTSWNARTNANVAAGIHSLFASTSNEFYLAGVQLEVGSQATPFEHRSFGEELALCQRYYYHTYSYGTPAGTTFDVDYAAPIIIIGTGNHGMGVCNGVYPVEMRASPTVSFYSSTGTANRIRYWGGAGGDLTYGTVNRSTRQILGMSLNAGSNPEDFYSAALVCDAEL